MTCCHKELGARGSEGSFPGRRDSKAGNMKDPLLMGGDIYNSVKYTF